LKDSKNGAVLSVLFVFLSFSTLYGQNGVVHERSFTHNDSLRSYLLYVPGTYSGQDDWPLVINFHGYQSSAKSQMKNHSKMNIIADTANFLVAYPEGLLVDEPFSGIDTGWNVPGFTSPNDDVAFTDSLLDHIDADFAIDLARIHATGWSNGSMMSFYLACELPDRIASVGGISGPMTIPALDSCNVKRPFSTLLIHGTSDPIVPFEGIPDFIPPAPATPSFWAWYNNCSPDTIVTDLPNIVTNDNSTVTLIEYVNCDNNIEVLFYRVNNGGHAWPGTGPNLSFLGKTNRDINASSEIWNFFKRNPHPNPSVGITDIVDNSLKTFQLFQNYPNPFNPTTSINYNLSATSNIELKIFNQLAQEIQTIINSRQPAGIHQVKWDGRDSNRNLMPSGLYFYRLKAESFVETRKMILLR